MTIEGENRAAKMFCVLADKALNQTPPPDDIKEDLSHTWYNNLL